MILAYYLSFNNKLVLFFIILLLLFKSPSDFDKIKSPTLSKTMVLRPRRPAMATAR